MLPSTLFASAASLAFASLAQAHGITYLISGGGKSHKSPVINSKSDPSPFYLVADNAPVHNVNSKELTCGRVASRPKKSATVSAGTTLTYKWNGGYSNHESASWPHDIGPMYFYMAKCNGDCSSIGSKAKWTKMAQFGMEGNGKWKQADLNKGKGLDFTIPSGLESGDYIIRHEVINLAIDQAELFPQCQWFTVTGGGSVDITTGDQVSFPGGYSSSDPGLTVSGAPAYAIKSNSAYKFPGPAVFKAGSSSNNGGSKGNNKPKDDKPKDDNSDEGSSATTTTKKSAPVPTAPLVNSGIVKGNVVKGNVVDNSDDTSSSDNDAKKLVVGDESKETESTTVEAENSTATEVSNEPSADGTTSPTGLSCADAWNACNAKYTGTVEDQENYSCHTEFNKCILAQLASINVKRMHRRRRSFSH